MITEFRLHIKSGNAALHDEPEREVARLLKQTARRIEGGDTSATLYDINGNPVGHYWLAYD